MKARVKTNRRGMVLLEVMMALAIFAVVAFSLVVALYSAFDAAEDRNHVDVALRGLDNQLALLHSARVLPGEQDAPDDGTGVAYHISITQEQMQDQKKQPVPNMYRATITATWTARNQPYERDVSALIYQP
jgi:prepilin-type N-terminal cleavage/methylation domain-containing protein